MAPTNDRERLFLSGVLFAVASVPQEIESLWFNPSPPAIMQRGYGVDRIQCSRSREAGVEGSMRRRSGLWREFSD